MTDYVIDASSMGPLIVPDETDELIATLPSILSSDLALVPSHWHLEVANLARMAIRKRRLTEPLLAKAFEALSVFTVLVDDLTERAAWSKTLKLAATHDLTAYDAAYLELSLRTGRTLVCKDKRLIRASEREGVELITA